MIRNNFIASKGIDQLGMVHDSNHSLRVSCARKNSNSISSEGACYGLEMDDFDVDSPGKRLKLARKRAGFETAGDFAEKAKIKAVTYRAYENEQMGFAKFAPQFAKLLGVTTDWLLVGGPVPDDLETQSARNRSIKVVSDDLDIEMVRQVDISYAMGDGSIVEDYPETGVMPFARNFLAMLGANNSDHLFICRGDGDSMSPTIFDNDLVMVDASRRRITLHDKIWALTVAGAGMIKRLRPLPTGDIMVLSDNPLVPEQVYSSEDVHIVGKVIWIGRRM